MSDRSLEVRLAFPNDTPDSDIAAARGELEQKIRELPITWNAVEVRVVTDVTGDA